MRTSPSRTPSRSPGRRGVLLAAIGALLLGGCGGSATDSGAEADGKGSSATSSSAIPSAAPSSGSPGGETRTGAGEPGSVLTEIPDDLDLASGLPEDEESGEPTTTDEPAFDEWVFCGETVWSTRGPGDGPVDLAGAAADGPEYADSRTLALYESTASAEAALRRIRDGWAACPSEDQGGTEQVYTPYPSDAGDEAAVMLHRYRLPEHGFDTGLEVLQAVRIGNALLLGAHYGEANGSKESRTAYIAQIRESSARPLAAMSVFGTDPAEPTAVPTEIPADLPLATGFPEDGSDFDISRSVRGG